MRKIIGGLVIVLLAIWLTNSKYHWGTFGGGDKQKTASAEKPAPRPDTAVQPKTAAVLSPDAMVAMFRSRYDSLSHVAKDTAAARSLLYIGTGIVIADSVKKTTVIATASPDTTPTAASAPPKPKKTRTMPVRTVQAASNTCSCAPRQTQSTAQAPPAANTVTEPKSSTVIRP
jgi:hypothetical protein